MEILTSTKGFLLNYKKIQISLDSEDTKADVAIYSKPSATVTSNENKVFSTPGEYEVKNCMIDGIVFDENQTAFSILADDIRVGYISELTNQLTDSQIESFAAVDILIVPITTDDKGEITTKVIGQIEPKIIIVHSFNQEDLKSFSSEFGKESEKLTKFKITKKDLHESDQQRLIVL